MGIRYYAYAYPRALTEKALANPRCFLSEDPLADAWGFEPGAAVGFPTFEQSVPKRQMLYLDKAWRHLQALTSPDSPIAAARPAYRMFAGQVTMYEHSWEPFVRELSPEEVCVIAGDVASIGQHELRESLAQSGLAGPRLHDEVDYTLAYLTRAQSFIWRLTTVRRGMVYMIG